MKEIDNTVRILYFSDEYKEFYEKLDIISQSKVDKIINYIRTTKQLTSNHTKKIQGPSNTNDIYEIIVTSTNRREYRILSVCFFNGGIIDNINLSDEMLLLNGFLKKSNKDYTPAMKKANRIVDGFLSDE